ncbi:hypothetical protein HK097_010530 [Rhizophlyctis rosea]|uniref:Uncharacterized protein n=1 Tax=Rhizophlyctis rosea TaxID=64517 RepID=A0AAD5S9S9_9FUNG|nr:hypothetical protein HK097_010530 [Rhizophlyctis rosea]
MVKTRSMYAAEERERLAREEAERMYEAQQERMAREKEENDRRDSIEAMGTARRTMLQQGILTQRQFNALEYTAQRAKATNDAFISRLTVRFAQLGFESDVLQKTFDYIRSEAPMIIHFRSNNNVLLTDTHHRCREELGGWTRQAQELHMFGPNSYVVGTPNFELVKYGVGNFVNDSNMLQTFFDFISPSD